MNNHEQPKNRTIFKGDNLKILRGIDTSTIDMIYLDPPFNTNKTWEGTSGAEDASFKDTWSSDDVDYEWMEDYRIEYPALYHFIKNMHFFARQSDCSYIAYMAIRIIECRRVLKDTGSLFYHCDHYMNDYIKVMLDIIFGRERDVNNIVWYYTNASRGKQKLAKAHDNIFWYSKTENYFFNREASLVPFASGMTKWRYEKGGQKGKEMPKGKTPDDVITMPSLNAMSKERTGYPTQKPLALLRKLIQFGTKENQIVLDPFCGCATTCVAAEQLGRQWIGIDLSKEAHRLVVERLSIDVQDFDAAKKQYDAFGENIDIHYRNKKSLYPHRTNLYEDELDGKWVYVISNPHFKGEYKVGIAADVQSRLNSYQTSDPNRAYKLEFSMISLQYRAIEKYIHKKFPNKHEWVQAKLEDIIKEMEEYK